MTKTLGNQTIVEFYNCNSERLKDVQFLEASMKEAATRAGATIVKTVFHEFSPYGVTGIVVVAESHLSVHTWPEHGYAAVDVFTCGELKNHRAINYLKRQLQSKEVSVFEIKRGYLGNVPHKP